MASQIRIVILYWKSIILAKYLQNSAAPNYETNKENVLKKQVIFIWQYFDTYNSNKIHTNVTTHCIPKSLTNIMKKTRKQFGVLHVSLTS
jgi:hypothetical protein